MTDVLLIVVIIILLVLQYLYARDNSVKEQKYIKALLAKSLPELVEAETEIKPAEPPKESDVIPYENLDDKGFSKMIKQQLEKQDGEEIPN